MNSERIGEGGYLLRNGDSLLHHGSLLECKSATARNGHLRMVLLSYNQKNTSTVSRRHTKAGPTKCLENTWSRPKVAAF